MKHVTLECEVFAAIARKCEEAYNEQTNPLAICKTTYSELSRECRLDWRSVKQTLEAMDDCKFIQMRPTAKGVIIMVTESAVSKGETTKMQSVQNKEEKQRKKILTPHTPLSYKKEEKKEEKGVGKEESTHTESASPLLTIEERKSAFQESIRPYVEKYGWQLCNEFYAYWTELTHDGAMMRFELQKTWSVGGRLAKWKRTEWDKDGFVKAGSRTQKTKREISESEAQIIAQVEAENEAARKEREERKEKAASVEEIRAILGDNCYI